MWRINWPSREPCGISVPWPGIEPVPPIVTAWSPHRRTTREFPVMTGFRFEKWVNQMRNVVKSEFQYAQGVSFTQIISEGTLGQGVSQRGIALKSRARSQMPSACLWPLSWRQCRAAGDCTFYCEGSQDWSWRSDFDQCKLFDSLQLGASFCPRSKGRITFFVFFCFCFFWGLASRHEGS